LLMYKIMREQWRWPLALAIGVAGLLALVDGTFAAANLTKVTQGGWVPLVTASLLFLLMEAWHSGRNAMLRQLERETIPLDLFIKSMAKETKVPGTAVYLSRRFDVVPVAMLHSVKHFQVLHQRVVILSVEMEQVPRIAVADHASVTALGNGFYRIVLHYGFMQQPDIPAALALCALDGEGFDEMQTTYFLSRVSIVRTEAAKERLNPFFCRLFGWLHRNEADATEFFRIPRNRIVELGAYLEL
jgi:KUP system potassium uptake protein